MDLEELRAKIDAVDDRLTAAYLERLELVTQVAEYKRAHAVEVEHTGREEAIFRRLAQKFGAEHRDAINYLYANIINYSKNSLKHSRNSPAGSPADVPYRRGAFRTKRWPVRGCRAPIPNWLPGR